MARFTVIESDAIPKEITDVITAQTNDGLYYAGQGYSHKIAKTNLVFSDQPQVGVNNKDAFFRERVSNPTGLFDSQFTYDLQPLLYAQITSGSGAIAHDRTNRIAHLSVTDADVGDTAIMQTFEYYRYQPGKSQLIFITFNPTHAVDGVTKFFGYSDGVNGYELRLVSGQLQVALLTESDQGNQFANQSEWNLDRFDGSPWQSEALDLNTTNIFFVDFQALYVGLVRFGFVVKGRPVYCHEFNNANIADFPYIASANLPVRAGMIVTASIAGSYEALATESGYTIYSDPDPAKAELYCPCGIVTDSSLAGFTYEPVNAQMNYICSAVVSEGGSDQTIGYGFSTDHEVTVSASTDTHMLSIQPKPLFNGFTNRIKFELEAIDFVVKGNNPVIWRLELGQALTGETVTDVNATYSGMSKVLGTRSGNGVIVITQGFVAATNQVKQTVSRNLINRYPITLNPDGTVRLLGRLSVVARADNNNTLCKVILNWREVR
jgi:hypothetical protein